MGCCKCKLKVKDGYWCPACRKEYNNEYHKSRVGKLSLKKSQSKYQKTENGNEAKKYANERYLKEQNRIIGGIMTGNENDFRKFMEEESKKLISKSGIERRNLYFKTVTLWRETLIKVGRIKGSFNGVWKKRNYKDVKQYYKDGGTFEEFVELCEWLVWPPDEKGADEKTKRTLKYISGLIKQSHNASTFRTQRQRQSIQGKNSNLVGINQLKYQIERRQKPKQDKDFGGYNG